MPNDQINQFIDRIIIAKGYDRLNDAVQKEIRADLHEKIIQVVNMALINALSEADAKKVMKLVEKQDEEKVYEIVEKKVDNPQAVIAEALVIFRQAYLHGAKRTEERGSV